MQARHALQPAIAIGRSSEGGTPSFFSIDSTRFEAVIQTHNQSCAPCRRRRAEKELGPLSRSLPGTPPRGGAPACFCSLALCCGGCCAAVAVRMVWAWTFFCPRPPPLAAQIHLWTIDALLTCAFPPHTTRTYNNAGSVRTGHLWIPLHLPRRSRRGPIDRAFQSTRSSGDTCAPPCFCRPRSCGCPVRILAARTAQPRWGAWPS